MAVADEDIEDFFASHNVGDDEEKQGGGAGAAASVASDHLSGVLSPSLLDAEGKQRLGTTTTSSGNRDDQEAEALRASLTDPLTEAERRLMKATTERDEVAQRLETALSAEPSRKVCAHDAPDGADALALGNFGAAVRRLSTSIEQAATDNKRDRRRSEDRRRRNLERVKEERTKFEAAEAKARTQHIRRTLTQLMLAVEMSPAVFFVSFLMTDALQQISGTIPTERHYVWLTLVILGMVSRGNAVWCWFHFGLFTTSLHNHARAHVSTHPCTRTFTQVSEMHLSRGWNVAYLRYPSQLPYEVCGCVVGAFYVVGCHSVLASRSLRRGFWSSGTAFATDRCVRSTMTLVNVQWVGASTLIILKKRIRMGTIPATNAGLKYSSVSPRRIVRCWGRISRLL